MVPIASVSGSASYCDRGYVAFLKGVCHLLEGDIPTVAFSFLRRQGGMSPSQDPGLKPGRPSPSPSLAPLLSPSLSLALSELPAVLGCLPRVEAAVLRRVSLCSCRGLVLAVRREEETAKPTRRPQRVRSSRGGDRAYVAFSFQRQEETTKPTRRPQRVRSSRAGRDARSSRPKHAPLPLRDVVFLWFGVGSVSLLSSDRARVGRRRRGGSRGPRS
ncbi:hypothetical protein Taro_027821 [Colocasia esculenta]|uniref:Uncharacterized protein n=1 Tax=Colocasia esculenta TaxID=4460 RepID=A0A843VL96_COLES|nr:hypothetical protein [Colocasia esculenta]